MRQEPFDTQDLLSFLTKISEVERNLNQAGHRHMGTPVIWSHGAWTDGWPEYVARPVTILGFVPKADA